MSKKISELLGIDQQWFDVKHWCTIVSPSKPDGYDELKRHLIWSKCFSVCLFKNGMVSTLLLNSEVFL